MALAERMRAQGWTGSQGQLSAFENEERTGGVPADQVEAICRGLGITVPELLATAAEVFSAAPAPDPAPEPGRGDCGANGAGEAV